LLALGGLLIAGPVHAQTGTGPAATQEHRGPPHHWAFGVWTGGLFPPGDPEGSACFANATIIVLRDVVLRASALDVAFHQRIIETVALSPEPATLEFRFTPALPMGTPFGARLAPDSGFGCEGGPNVLRAQRRGADEMIFPECRDFVSPLKRCGPPGR
jgi:hypothetical protein